MDSFVAFKKLMVKRNTELNEQAMRMIGGGANPAMPTPQLADFTKQDAAKIVMNPQQQQVPPRQAPQVTKEMLEAQAKAEEELIRQAMEASLAEEKERKQQVEQEEEELMKRVMEMSMREERERQTRLQLEAKQEPVKLSPQDVVPPQHTERLVEPAPVATPIAAPEMATHVPPVKELAAAVPKKRREKP